MSSYMSVDLMTELSARELLELICEISGLSTEIYLGDRGYSCRLEPNSIFARDSITDSLNKRLCEGAYELYNVRVNASLYITMHWEDREPQELRILDWVEWFLVFFDGDIVWQDRLQRLPETYKVTDYIRPLA